MKRSLLALVLMTVPVAAAPGDATLYAVYAGGHYEDAMRDGAATHTAYGYAIAARAALADAVLRDAPCRPCIKRGEDYARSAVALDPKLADGQIWLAVALGYETRIDGVVMGRLHDTPGQSRAALDAAVKDDPGDAYAVSALGGWHIEVVRGGGATMARLLYGASEAQAIQLFDQAVRLAPGNVAVRYQIALSLAGLDPDKYRARIETELAAAIHDTPETAYEKAIQSRAADLQALLRRGDGDALAARVRKYQGYPE